MIFLSMILALAFHVGALWTGAEALREHELWSPNKAQRNRYAFACLCLSAAALLTAYRIGVSVAGC